MHSQNNLWVMLLLTSYFVFMQQAGAQQQNPKTQTKKPKHNFVFEHNAGSEEEISKLSRIFTDSSKTTVLWWNVFMQGIDNKALNENLLAFMQKPRAVDILVLGEFDTANTLNAEAMATLLQHYPYTQTFYYSKAYSGPKDRSILVASRYLPKRRTYIENGLPWTDPGSKKSEQNEYEQSWARNKFDKQQAKQWTRSFQSLSFDLQGKDLTIVPVHLANPWAAIKNTYNYDSLGITKHVCAGCSVVFGDDNPLANQIENLSKKAQGQYHGKNGQRVLLFGDFNMPRSVAYKNTWAYEHLTTNMYDNTKDHKPTFPTKTAVDKGNKSPAVEIDHCFTAPANNRTVTSHIIELKGSDHYPLLIEVD